MTLDQLIKELQQLKTEFQVPGGSFVHLSEEGRYAPYKELDGVTTQMGSGPNPIVLLLTKDPGIDQKNRVDKRLFRALENLVEIWRDTLGDKDG